MPQLIVGLVSNGAVSDGNRKYRRRARFLKDRGKKVQFGL